MMGGPRPGVGGLAHQAQIMGLVPHQQMHMQMPMQHNQGYQQYLEPGQIRGEFVANDGLPAAYASAGVVLNDHWSDMAAEGFLSNRLFDAAATGARIVSDEAVGLRDVFGTDIRTYGHQSELCDLLSGDRGDIFPGRAARLALAARIAVEHSFDQRAGELIAEAQRLLAR